MKKIVLAMAAVVAVVPTIAAEVCTPTGFFRDTINMTAALINPTSVVTGEVDATGCNVGVYFDHTGSGGIVSGARIHGANYFGVVVNGDGGVVDVDVMDSSIYKIGESPLNGVQRGVAVFYRGFFAVSQATGTISGNVITGYQKGGIVANGIGTSVTIKNNSVTGAGRVDWIAQNGIQIGFGADAMVSYNTVSGNSYIGTDGWAAGGITTVGGSGYGNCPDGSGCPYTVGTKVMNNILVNNDVGVYMSNLGAYPNYSAPLTQTNAKVVNNTISSDACYNVSYQAGISNIGNNDKLINNTISGTGYTKTEQCAVSFKIDADASFTNRVKVHATK